MFREILAEMNLLQIALLVYATCAVGFILGFLFITRFIQPWEPHEFKQVLINCVLWPIVVVSWLHHVFTRQRPRDSS